MRKMLMVAVLALALLGAFAVEAAGSQAVRSGVAYVQMMAGTAGLSGVTCGGGGSGFCA